MIHLIDSENVSLLNSLHVIEKKEGNQVIVFLHKKTTSENYNVAELLLNLTIEEHMECRMMPFLHKRENDLDFQIVSYLGYLIGLNDKNEEYVIVSNDRGFDSVVQFWSRKGYHVRREGVVITKSKEEKESEQRQTEQTMQQLEDWLKNLFLLIRSKTTISKEERDFITNLIVNYKVQGKISLNEMHNKMQQTMPGKRATIIYQIMKKQLSHL